MPAALLRLQPAADATHHFVGALVVDYPVSTCRVVAVRGLRVEARQLTHHSGRCQPVLPAADDIDRTANPLGIDRRSARKVERPQAGLENRASGFVNHAFVQSVLTIGRQAAEGVALRARKALLVGLGDRESLLPSCLRRCARLDLYSLDALRVFGRLLDVEVENAFVQVRLNGSLVRSER
jgi:hypothetical protein